MNTIIDAFLAGIYISTSAVAAIGIAMPIVYIANSICGAFVSGCSIHYSQVLGRGRHQRAQEVYTEGIQATIISGLFFFLVNNIFARPLVIFFGAKDPEVIVQSITYLRLISFSTLTTCLSELVIKGLSMYGLNKTSLIACSVRLVSNIVLSIIFVKILPHDMKIIGLALGTILSAVLGTAMAYYLKARKKVGLSYISYKPRLVELKAMFKDGFSTSADYLAGAVAGAVLNNAIGASALGTNGIALYAAVSAIFGLAMCPCMAMQSTVAPLFGMLHGAADKRALLKSFSLSLRNTIILSLAFCFVLDMLLGSVLYPLIKAGGTLELRELLSGVRYSYLAVIPTCILYIFACLFELTDRGPEALCAEIIPDSVIMVISTVILLKLGLGYKAIWLSYSISTVLFIIGYVLQTWIKYKKVTIRNLCRLDEWEPNVSQEIDVSIRNKDTDISSLTKTVHDFLNNGQASKKTAYATALCMDELASDIVAHTQRDSDSHRAIMDIKLLTVKDEFRIIIRNLESPYNPLDFELDTETFAKVGIAMAQRIAKKISYQYLYNMNIITIYIDK